MRRALKWALRGLAGLALLVAALLLAALWLLRTDAGLEVVRGLAEDAANDALLGEIRIRRLSGDALDHLVLEGLSVRVPSGREAIRLEHLDLEWRPAALLSGTLAVERLRLEAPQVHLVRTATGGLELGALLPPSEPDPEPKEEGPLDLPHLLVERVEIRDADLSFVDEGAEVFFADGLAVDLSAEAEGDGAKVDLSRLEARLMREHDVTLGFRAALDGDRVRVRDLALRAHGAALEIPGAQATLPPGRVRANLSLSLPPGVAARLGAPKDLVAGADLALALRRPADSPRWSVTATGTLAGAGLALDASATEDLVDLQAVLRLSRLDPRRVHARAPQGDLDVRLDARGDLLAPRLDAALTVDGWIRPPAQPRVTLSGVRLDARWTGDGAAARLSGQAGAARIRADADLSGLAAGAPRVEDAHVDLDVPDLARLAGPAGRGALTLSATVSGSLDALAAQGRLQAEGLGWAGAASVGALEAQWSLAGVPSDPRGDVKLGARQIRAGGRPIRGVELAAEAAQVDAGTEVRLVRLQIRTGDLTWAGDGARALLGTDGALTVEGLGLRSAAGRIEARLEAEAPGPARGPVRARVELHRLDLAALPRRVAPELGDLRGRVDLRADVARRGHRIRGEVRVRARGVALAEDRPALDADLGATLAPARLAVTATVAGAALGRVVVDAHAAPPARMGDPAAWRRALAASPVEAVVVEFEGLRPSGISGLAGLPAYAEGRVDGRLRVDGSKQAHLQISATDLVTADGPPLEGAVQLDAGFSPGRAWATARVEGPAFGWGVLTATASAPRRLFDADGWRQLGPESVGGARVELREIRVGVLEDLRILDGVDGRIDADISAGPALRPIEATVGVRDLVTPWVDRPLTLGLVSALTKDRFTGDFDASLGGREVLRASASAPLPLSRLLEAPPDALARVPVSAEVRLDALPLAPFAPAARLDPRLVRGTLSASVSASGTLDAPRAEGWASFDDLVLAEAGFEAVTATASLRGRDVSAEVRIRDAKGGQLTLDADVDRFGEAVDARVRARGLRLGFLSRLGLLPVGVQGGLHADLAVTGGAESVEPRGWAEVRELRVVFPQAALQPIHDARARIDLEGGRATVALAGRSVGGEVKLDAQADLPDGGATTFETTLKLTEYPVAAGTLVRVSLDAEAKGRGGPEGTQVDVRLSRGLIDVPDEGTEDLHPIEDLDDVVFVDRLPGGTGGRRTRTATRAAGPPTVVDIRTTEPIDVRGGPVDAALVTELVARAGAGGARIEGGVRTTQGFITLLRRRYVIERAELVFEGRSPPDPRVKVRLRHDFPRTSFSVVVEGTASDPDLRFESRPASYSRSELLAIFLGTDPDDLGKTSGKSPEQQAFGAVAGLAVGKLQDELGRALPVDTLDVELGEGGAAAGTRITLGRWITRKIFVAYRYKFEANTQEENDSEAVVQYRFLPGWMVEVVLGLTRNQADLLWMKRF